MSRRLRRPAAYEFNRCPGLTINQACDAMNGTAQDAGSHTLLETNALSLGWSIGYYILFLVSAGKGESKRLQPEYLKLLPLVSSRINELARFFTLDAKLTYPQSPFLIGGMAAHKGGPKNCPFYYNDECAIEFIAGQLQLCAACRRKLKKDPETRKAIEAILQAYA